jgi:hypothetical protein
MTFVSHVYDHLYTRSHTAHIPMDSYNRLGVQIIQKPQEYDSNKGVFSGTFRKGFL